MTQIHVISQTNRNYYAEILRQYHRLRHDVFVVERKWTELYKPDGMETDQYDNEHSIYLLAIDGGKVVGGQRLYPTVRPHMLSETFPHLIDGPLPVHERTLEWTRYFVVKERRRTPTDGRLLASIQLYCLEEGITDLTAVGEMWWLPRWHQYGFIIHPLGLPRDVGGQPAVAVRVQISEESYASVLRTAGLKHEDLMRHQLHLPMPERITHVA